MGKQGLVIMKIAPDEAILVKYPRNSLSLSHNLFWRSLHTSNEQVHAIYEAPTVIGRLVVEVKLILAIIANLRL